MGSLVLTVLVSVLSAGSARAQITDGGVYRIINRAYGTALSEDYVNNRAKCLTVGDDTAYEQLWIVRHTSGNKYSFQNIFTGHYVGGAGTGTSAYFPMSTSSVAFTVSPNSVDASCYDVKGNSLYWHCGASQGDYLVGWYAYNGSENEASAWIFQEEKPLSEAAIEAARAEYAAITNAVSNASAYQKALPTFFVDNACTELQPDYASSSDDELRAAMAEAGLPEALQEMAVKVKNNGWADHEEKFRVHDYQPYSNPVEWQKYTQQNYQSWMNQPTGIASASRQILYVMVDGDVPKNSTLYINGYASGWTGSGTEGTQLHKGLNIVLMSNPDEMLYIFYTADTYHNGAKDRVLADFPDIKIHIEGGSVSGYWRKGDTAADWNWYVKNATLTRFLLVGEYCIWNMPKQYAFQHLNASNVDKSMAMYDWLVKWEWAMQGLISDYDDVEYGTTITRPFIDGTTIPEENVVPSKYNNKGFAYSDDTGYMDATNYRTHFNNNTLGTILPFNNTIQGAGYFWGPAHEFGHTNQGAINMPGCTEVSNNLLSEVVNFMVGFSDSRGSSTDVLMDDFAAGRYFYERDIWQMCRMYYQLFLYYHAAQKDPTFYPRLFKALRNDRLVFGGGGDENAHPQATLGENMHLKFALKCCEVAQEDLTDFFEAYGFFVPMDYVFVGDYTGRRVTATPAKIAECKAAIKAKGYPKNSIVQLLEDRIGDVPKACLAAAEGKTGYKTFYGDAGYPSDDKLPKYGQYTDVSSDQPATGYSFVQKGNTLVVSGGEHALGFNVYDAGGTLIAFSTTGTIMLPSDFTGDEITVCAMNGTGCAEPYELVAGDYDASESNLSLLKEALAGAEAMVALKDVEGTHPGWYAPAALQQLEELVAEAKQAVADKESASYVSLIDALKAEIANVQANTEAKTPLRQGCFYALQNVQYANYSASINSGAVKCTTGAVTADAKKWGFLPAGGEGEYYIYTKDRHYISHVSRSTQVTTVTDVASAAVFFMGDNGDGSFYFQETGDDNNFKVLHCDASKNMVGWNTEATASHWNVVLTEEVIDAEIRESLYNLSSEILSFADAAVTEGGTIKLQTSSPTGKGYISTNAQEKSEGPIANLVDGSTSTFFHSSWQSATDEYHYLQVDLGQGVTLSEFTFGYTMRSGDHINAPTKIVISGSNDGRNFTDITTLTKKDATNPLPSTSSQSTYNSSVIACGEAYRYFRFTVMETVNNRSAGNCGYPYFSMAEFSMEGTNKETVINPGYEGIDTEALAAVAAQAEEAMKLSTKTAATAEELQAAYDSLLAAYEVLLQSIGNLTGHVVTLSSKAYNGRCVTERMDGSNAHSVYGLTANDSNTPGAAAQQWIIRQSGDKYTLQNVFTGRYLKHSTKNDEAWSTVTAQAAASVFYLYRSGDYISFDYVSADGKGDKSGMHCGGQNGYRICHWTTSVDPSLWTMTDVANRTDDVVYSVIVTGNDGARVECDKAITGTKVMNGGFFYVPAGTTLSDADITASELRDYVPMVTVDNTARTITVAYVDTSIDVLPADDSKLNPNDGQDIIFDLYGRRVEEPTEGIYIVNGKKMLIK